MSEPNEFMKLLREVVVALERTGAELRKLESSIERQQKADEKHISDLRSEISLQGKGASEETRRLTDQISSVTSLWNASQRAEKQASDRRANAVAAVWSSPAGQMLVVGLVVIFLQLAGVSWVVKYYLPQLPPQHTIEEKGL